MSEPVADAEPSEALDFGEGAEEDDGAAFLNPLDGGGRFGDEFVVGFVENEEWTVGKFLDEGSEFGIGNAGTGGVIWGSEENEADIALQAGGEAGEVVMEIAIGDFFERDMEESSHEAVDGEGVGGGENEALDFGESAKEDEGAAFFNPLDGGGRFGDELVVGFVENKEWTVGKFLDEGSQFGVGDACAGGVIGGSEEDESDIVLQAGG